MKKRSKAIIIVSGAIAGLLVVTAITLLVIKPMNNNSGAVLAPDYWPTDGWQSNTPEQQGLDLSKLDAALEAIVQDHIPIHSLLIAINGYSVVNATFYPYDGNTP